MGHFITGANNCLSGTLLTAYFVIFEGKTLDTNEIVTFIETKTNLCKVPDKYVIIKELPLLISGEVDYEKLDHTYEKPMNQSQDGKLTYLEKELLVIWRKLLRRRKVCLESNFFSLGGNSILVVQMCDKIRKQLNINVSIIDIFEYPTIRRLAKWCISKEIKDDYIEQSRARKNKFIKSIRQYSSTGQ